MHLLGGADFSKKYGFTAHVIYAPHENTDLGKYG